MSGPLPTRSTTSRDDRSAVKSGQHRRPNDYPKMLAWTAIAISVVVIGGIFHTYSSARSGMAADDIGFRLHAHTHHLR